MLEADGSTISHTAQNAGCIIDRAKMQADMANECKSLGAELRLNSQVADVGPLDQSMRTVRFVDGSVLQARVVIDASGPVAGLGKHDKLAWKPADLEPAFFVVRRTRASIPIRSIFFLEETLRPAVTAGLSLAKRIRPTSASFLETDTARKLTYGRSLTRS